MKAIVVENGALVWTDVADPVAGPDEVIVHVRAAGVNRADLMQARGAYPPPAGASPILGLEIAGVVEGTGERVCSLLPGGGYAEKAVVHREMLIPMPEAWSFALGASVPEAWLTAFVNLFLEGKLARGESVLIHAGASGVGLAAIQLARMSGAQVLTTVRTVEKRAHCAALGASVLGSEFEGDVMRETQGKGVDVIVDCVGGSYLAQNVACLGSFGRLVNIGLLGGAKGELNMSHVLRKRLRIVGSTLRSRPRTEQIAITAEFRRQWWARMIAGEMELGIDRVFPMALAGEAHTHMGENRNTGKIVLVLD